MKALPLGARKIGRIWPIEEGGFGVTASTDSAGQPIIGIYPLNRFGHPSGQESHYAYQHLLIRIVAGYDGEHKAIVVVADIEVTTEGLFLRVVMPLRLMERGLPVHLSAKWKSAPPELYKAPANLNWADEPVIRQI